jgi:hypothetical protein
MMMIWKAGYSSRNTSTNARINLLSRKKLDIRVEYGTLLSTLR